MDNVRYKLDKDANLWWSKDGKDWAESKDNRIRSIMMMIVILEQLPFEEWLSYLESMKELGMITDLKEAVLNEIACNHVDDSWRFNAIDLLIDNQMLTEDIRAIILEKETDEEILQLLND